MPEINGETYETGMSKNEMYFSGGRAVYRCDDGTYVISLNRVWIPGAYDTVATALKAFGYDDEFLSGLWYSYHDRGVDPIITMADLDVAPKSRRAIISAGRS